jgi:hypothetical protein
MTDEDQKEKCIVCGGDEPCSHDFDKLGKTLDKLGASMGTGFQGKYSVDEFARERRTTDPHRLCQVIRRSSPDAPYEWAAVRGLSLKVADPKWAGYKFFTYRSGVVVFAVEEKSGVTVAAASSLSRVRDQLTENLADHSHKSLDAAIAEAVVSADAGTRPIVKLKTL